MIVALGDLMLDIVLQAKSAAAEASHGSARATVGAGGSAANFAVWAARLRGRGWPDRLRGC
jgi:sugar/nucleoside kinase (ribokinase family)